MNNREKLIKIGETIFGNQWQTPISKLLGVDSRTVRSYIAGDFEPPMTYQLVEILEIKHNEINELTSLIKSNLISEKNIQFGIIEPTHSPHLMDNREILIKIGETIFGNQWQTPISKLLGVDSRTVRRYVSGDASSPTIYSLLKVLDEKQTETRELVSLIKSDFISGDDVTTDVIESIISQYSYDYDQHYRKAAIDAVNNAICRETYLSDLHQVAKKYAQEE